jgi:uncharacterized protein involved in outer membrane biogenesis
MRAFRWIFITVGVVAILLVLVIVAGSAWLNTFVHSDSFRQEVETRAGQSLGGTVQIQAIDVGLFSGLNLKGLVTQVDAAHSGGQGALSAKIETVNCSWSWGELLNRRLELTGVTLDRPDIILTRQSSETTTAPSGPLPSAATETGAPPTSAGLPAFQFVLEGAKVVDGDLSIRDATGAPMADLQGVNLGLDSAGYYTGKEVTGNLTIATMALPSNLQITDFSTPLVYGPHGAYMTAKPFAASAFGGSLAGGYELKGGPAASILEVNGKGLDVAQIGRAVNPNAAAKLSGSLDMQSKWQGVETGAIQGEGDAQLSGGKLTGVSMLNDISSILGIKELNDPDLRSVQTHFQVANGVTRFTGLQLDAGAFQMTGDGTIGPGSALDANMVLILGADAMTRLPKQAASFFVQKPDGSASIAFHVGGTLDHPQTDLATRLFLQNVKVQNVLKKAFKNFFH